MTLFTEAIFMWLTENSFVITNDTGTSEISTPSAIAVEAHFHAWHGSKPILVF